MAILYHRDKCQFHGKRRCKKCRCPVCKRGYMIESPTVFWCSRRYAPKKPCTHEAT